MKDVQKAEGMRMASLQYNSHKFGNIRGWLGDERIYQADASCSTVSEMSF